MALASNTQVSLPAVPAMPSPPGPFRFLPNGGSLLRFVWSTFAFLLVVISIWFMVVQILAYKNVEPFNTALINRPKQESWFDPLVEMSLMVFLIGFIGIVEGAEIAVSGLVDKDSDEFPDNRMGSFIERIQQSAEAFLSGRQLMAVAALVLLTEIARSFADFGPVTDRGWAGAVLQIGTATWLQKGFAFALPIFVVLWFAQLPLKFAAHQNPLRVFSLQFVQSIVRLSMLAGTKVQVGAPSRWVLSWINRRWANETGPQLKVGRARYYRIISSLQYGRGVESFVENVQIGASGEVKVNRRCVFKSFDASRNRSITLAEGWSSAILSSPAPRLDITDIPAACGACPKSGPNFLDETIGGQEVKGAYLMWTITPVFPIPLGQTLEYELEYSAAAGALESAVGESDYYEHQVITPTKDLTFSFTPAPDAPFVLTGPKRWATVYDPEEDKAEAEQIEVSPSGDGGLRFSIKYPLVGSKLRFSWTLGAR
jgi:hypothetical protein